MQEHFDCLNLINMVYLKKTEKEVSHMTQKYIAKGLYAIGIVASLVCLGVCWNGYKKIDIKIPLLDDAIEKLHA